MREWMLAALVLAAVACGKDDDGGKSSPKPTGSTDPGVDSKLFGIWQLDIDALAWEGDASKKDDTALGLQIADGVVTAHAFCRDFTTEVRVAVSAPAKISAHSIEILDDADAEDGVDDVKCTASLEKGKLAYEFLDTHCLKLTTDDGQSLAAQSVASLGQLHPERLAPANCSL